MRQNTQCKNNIKKTVGPTITLSVSNLSPKTKKNMQPDPRFINSYDKLDKHKKLL